MSFSLTGNEIKGPLRWWYNIGAPPNVPNDAPLKRREIVRIGKITSLALAIELLEMAIAGFSTVEDPNKLMPFAYLGIVVSLLIALVFNRSGQTRIAGIIAVVMIEFAMILTILGVPHQQLTSFNLPLFALFIQPLLIAASLFPIWLIFPLAIYHIAWIILAITFMSKTPDLVENIRHMPYTAYGIPITLQVITTLISFIWVRSAYEEMHRAETAEEVNRLTQQIADHMAAAAGRQEELERNIEVIRSTLVSVSNGNYQQQVPLTQGDVLWPVALSLNNLLKRMRSFREQGHRFTQVNTLLSSFANELHQHRTGQRNIHLPQTNTGTALDLLAAELRSWLAASDFRTANQSPIPSMPGQQMPPQYPPFKPPAQPTSWFRSDEQVRRTM